MQLVLGTLITAGGTVNTGREIQESVTRRRRSRRENLEEEGKKSGEEHIKQCEGENRSGAQDVNRGANQSKRDNLTKSRGHLLITNTSEGRPRSERGRKTWGEKTNVENYKD